LENKSQHDIKLLIQFSVYENYIIQFTYNSTSGWHYIFTARRHVFIHYVVGIVAAMAQLLL